MVSIVSDFPEVRPITSARAYRVVSPRALRFRVRKPMPVGSRYCARALPDSALTSSANGGRSLTSESACRSRFSIIDVAVVAALPKLPASAVRVVSARKSGGPRPGGERGGRE